MINKICELVNGTTYTRTVPKEAIKLAKENGYIIIVGGSDDLMYCFGAECYMTDCEEHSYGWDGDTLTNIEDKKLEAEAKQLGLEIYWCGEIIKGDKVVKKIDNYDTEKQGAFSYKVKEEIKYKNFIVYEDEKKNEIYCTGIIIELPKKFKREKEDV